MKRAKVGAERRARVRRGNVEDADQLRAELLAAAAEMLLDGGLDAVSVRAVAARVGVSAMTPYRYFPSKAELLSGLWQYVLGDLHAAMARAVASARGARARHAALIDSFVAYWEAHVDHYRLVYPVQGVPRSGPGGVAQVEVYGQLLQLAEQVTAELAALLKAPRERVKLASDVRLAMQLGYLQATLVNRRYPWSSPAELRPAYLRQVALAVERCLLGDA